MARPTGPTGIVLAGALFALFFPSSAGGVISLTLDRAALAISAVFSVLLVATAGGGERSRVLMAIGIVAWPALLTLRFPQAEFAAGSLLTFVALGGLVAADLSGVRLGARSARLFWLAINLFVLVVGVGLSLNVGVVNDFIKTFYSAFYPGLLVSMIDWYHKPVLTLATHSTAGFFFYLFFWLNFRTWRATGHRTALFWTVTTLAIGANVRSTTSTMLMGVAALQFGIDLLRRVPRRNRGIVVLVGAPALLIALVLADAPGHAAQLVDLVGGSQTAGLRARYSTTGMLGGNLRYLNESPFTPIGFTYGPEDLFYGDSGAILMLVRGSLPLLVMAYLAYGRFLSRNLLARVDFRCLLLVTLAFEVGYTPLQLFRFTAFLPFMVLYLNGLPPEPSRAFAFQRAKKLDESRTASRFSQDTDTCDAGTGESD
jgi:hypothetical protein